MDAEAALIGRTIAGRYQIERCIGRGGMASVFAARQDAEPREVAIKIMKRDLMKDATVVKRFRREAKAAAMLNHPNTVRVLDYGVDGEDAYIAMELAKGKDLFQALAEERPMTQTRSALVVAQVCAALSAAHAQGIVHRDLKPENVMLVPEAGERGGELVKVLDFGIAKILEAPGDGKDGKDGGDHPPERSETSTNLTRVGTVVGTPAYMSPEQCRGGELDGRSDVYSSGVLLYQLLTGQLPFLGETPLHTAMRHIHAPPRPPSELRQNLHKDLERVVLKALAKWPGERQQSAEQLRDELLATIEALPDRDLVLGTEAPATAAAVPAASPSRRAAEGQSPKSLTREPTEHQLGMRLGGGLGKLVAPLEGKSVPPIPPPPASDEGDTNDEDLERNETPIVEQPKPRPPEAPAPGARATEARSATPRAGSGAGRSGRWDEDEERTRLRPPGPEGSPRGASVSPRASAPAGLPPGPPPGRGQPPADDDDDDGPRTALMTPPASVPGAARPRGSRTLLMESGESVPPPKPSPQDRASARTQPQPASAPRAPSAPPPPPGNPNDSPGIRQTVRLGSPTPMAQADLPLGRRDNTSAAYARTQNASALAASIYEEASSAAAAAEGAYLGVKATQRIVADEASGGAAGVMAPGMIAPPLAPPPPPARPAGADGAMGMAVPAPPRRGGVRGSLEGLPGTTVLVVGVALGVVFSAVVILLVVYLARG